MFLTAVVTQSCARRRRHGIVSALNEVYPQTRQQLCWEHKSANLLNSLPRSLTPKAKHDLHQIRTAATRGEVQREFDRFIRTYERQISQSGAVRCLANGREELLAFYHFPAAY